MLGWQVSSSSYMCLGSKANIAECINEFRAIESQSAEGSDLGYS